jgi:two-component system sensor histidine kinase KdpD
LATAIVASRLSAKAKSRALEAIERQRDLERLYAFSRAMLLIDEGAPFGRKLIEKLAENFHLANAVLYERETGNFHYSGTHRPEGLEDMLRSASGVAGYPPHQQAGYVIVNVSRGAEPVASIALTGGTLTEPVMQGIANLVAIGLERARAQQLAQQAEAARQSEQLRTTLIDAMAHEFKTPLTLIKAATTSLLANPNVSVENRNEQISLADEEAEHLRELIDHAIEIARLDTTRIEIHPEIANLNDTLHEVINSVGADAKERPLKIIAEQSLPSAIFDKRLMKLAIRQLLDNALKYTPSDTLVEISTQGKQDKQIVEITDYGPGIPADEQSQIFERFYRSPSIKKQIPGSGLGLSITEGIVRAHEGEVTVSSQPGHTVFRITIPVRGEEEQ